MALSLNTSHPLYSYLAALICVDDDGVVKDLLGAQTCTTDASVVIGSGTYGRHFRTTIVSNNALGVALSPGIVAKPVANPVGTTFVVINAGNSRASRGDVFNQPSTGTVGPGVYTGDAVGVGFGSAYPTTLGTTDIIGTGAKSFAVGYSGVTGQLGSKVAVNGAVENSTTTNIGNANDTYKHTYIGGTVTGGYGGFAADYVWIAHFNRYLTDTEISDLHASLAADNAFSLVESGGDSYTLALDAGSYSITGQSILTHTELSLDLDTGSYSITGQDLSLLQEGSYRLNLEAGAYNIVSEEPNVGISMILEAGTYTVTGNTVRLVSSQDPVIVSKSQPTVSIAIRIGL